LVVSDIITLKTIEVPYWKRHYYRHHRTRWSIFSRVLLKKGYNRYMEPLRRTSSKKFWRVEEWG